MATDVKLRMERRGDHKGFKISWIKPFLIGLTHTVPFICYMIISLVTFKKNQDYLKKKETKSTKRYGIIRKLCI